MAKQTKKENETKKKSTVPTKNKRTKQDVKPKKTNKTTNKPQKAKKPSRKKKEFEISDEELLNFYKMAEEKERQETKRTLIVSGVITAILIVVLIICSLYC